jgi:hypothetical protein
VSSLDKNDIVIDIFLSDFADIFFVVVMKQKSEFVEVIFDGTFSIITYAKSDIGLFQPMITTLVKTIVC